MQLGDKALLGKLTLKRMHRAQFTIAGKDVSDSLGLGLIDQKLVGASFWHVISKWKAASHPHALGFGSGDLVADTLAGNLAFELGKGKKDVEHEPSHRVLGVERLGD